MHLLVALHASAALLLAVAGVMKLLVPQSAASLFKSLRLRGGVWLARPAGSAEVIVGAGALVTGAWLFTAAVALTYLVFAFVVWRGLVVGIESCGCFGDLSAPPSWIHLAGNVALAAVSIAAAVTGETVRTVVDTAIGQGTTHLFALLLMICTITLLEVVMFTALPEGIGVKSSASVQSSESFRIHTGNSNK